MYWVLKSSDECSGLGSVLYDENKNILRVIDAFMLPQKNGAASTDIEAVDISKAQFEHFKNKRPGELRWWWHSHVNMSVFWSGTDIATLKNLGAAGWYCATVFNKRREVKSAFVQGKPIRLLIEEVKTSLAENLAANPEWDAEYDRNVQKKTYASFTYPGGSSANDGSSFKEFLQQFKTKSEGTKTTEEESKAASLPVDKKPNLIPVQKKHLIDFPAGTFIQFEKTGTVKEADPNDPTKVYRCTSQGVCIMLTIDEEKEFRAEKKSQLASIQEANQTSALSDTSFGELTGKDKEIVDFYYSEDNMEERLCLLESIEMYDKELADKLKAEDNKLRSYNDQEAAREALRQNRELERKEEAKETMRMYGEGEWD
jgi:hypothetical protein